MTLCDFAGVPLSVTNRCLHALGLVWASWTGGVGWRYDQWPCLTCAILINPVCYFLLIWLCHLTLPSSCHPSVTYSHHPYLSPDPITHSCHPILYSTLSCLVTCYACQSHVTHMTISFTWLFANLLSNCSHVARQALPAIVITWFGILCELTICPVKFYDMLYFILQLLLTCFISLSLD